MGNSHDKDPKKNQGSTKNSTQVDQNVEIFLKKYGFNDNFIDVPKLLGQFSNSFIVEKIVLNHSNNNQIETSKIKHLFSEIYQTYSNSSIFELYFNILFDSENEIEFQTIKRIFHDCLYYSLKQIDLEDIEISEHSQKTLDSIINNIQFSEINGKRITSKESFKQWTINEFPQLFYGFHNWFIKYIRNQNTDPTTPKKTTDLSQFMNIALVWYFVNNLPNCYVKNLASENGNISEKLSNCLTEKGWQRLYSSENHGLSLNRFQSSLFNYKAATIVFIYCNSGNLFCVCSNEEYKESPLAYGDGLTRIFRIWNDFKIYDVTSSNNIYLNTKSRGIKLGLIFGYSQLKPYLKIDEDFHHIEHELNKSDQIISVEAWGCGPRKAALDQESMKKWENKQIEKMRTVNRNAEGWSESADKAILDLAGIKTEHSERGDF